MLMPSMSVTMETSMIMSNIQRIVQVRVTGTEHSTGGLAHALSADVLSLKPAPQHAISATLV